VVCELARLVLASLIDLILWRSKECDMSVVPEGTSHGTISRGISSAYTTDRI